MYINFSAPIPSTLCVRAFSYSISYHFTPFIAIPYCQAKREDLAHFPTTLAPISGSKPVTTRCADNAHTRTGSSLDVTCSSDGTWSVQIPQCDCDTGYRKISENGRKKCKGKIKPIQKVL